MFKCTNCGNASAMKLGKCPSCGEFGSFVEDVDKAVSKKSNSGKTLISSIKEEKIVFWEIKEPEMKRILNRGIKKSGIYLLGGEPGIGKSTIVLQIISDLKILNQINIGYFSGEENSDQIRDRITRLGLNLDDLQIFHTTSLEDIMMTSKENQFDLIIVDSVQTVYSSEVDSIAGSINQVKYCSEKISEFCKKNRITCIVIGHVTKGGEIAGPKYLEHIVDVVLQIEGDRFGQYRFLRTSKNRFDSTDDVGIFEMTLFGLKPVYDLKDRILNAANVTIPGNVLTIGIENTRPVIVNLEVLLNKTQNKYPQRAAIGVDPRRLDLIIAILERYMKLNLTYFDIYVNIPGEMKFFDSGLDLSIAVAIYSQYKNKLIDKNLIFLGELGLGGQVLKSKLHEKRLKEVPNGFEVVDFGKLKNIVEVVNFI